ncbi:hypothetical protein L7F22_034841 [Adiantum nelumboides]|nr:hypothetical protein [Adiantum nelumboides]
MGTHFFFKQNQSCVGAPFRDKGNVGPLLCAGHSHRLHADALSCGPTWSVLTAPLLSLREPRPTAPPSCPSAISSRPPPAPSSPPHGLYSAPSLLLSALSRAEAGQKCLLLCPLPSSCEQAAGQAAPAAANIGQHRTGLGRPHAPLGRAGLESPLAFAAGPVQCSPLPLFRPPLRARVACCSAFGQHRTGLGRPHAPLGRAGLESPLACGWAAAPFLFFDRLCAPGQPAALLSAFHATGLGWERPSPFLHVLGSGRTGLSAAALCLAGADVSGQRPPLLCAVELSAVGFGFRRPPCCAWRPAHCC